MPKVMVVDDDKDIVQVVKFLLEHEQFEVIEACNGLEAYHKLTEDGPNKAAPDVIILDIMMPVMDGYTFQSKLQEHDELGAIPIIIFTAYGRMKELFISSNIFAFVEKPFESKDFVKIVREALALKRGCPGFN